MPQLNTYCMRNGPDSDPVFQFNTVVKRVVRVEEADKWLVSTEPARPLLIDGAAAEPDQAEVQNVPGSQQHLFDVLLICNGHFAQPRLPECAARLRLPWLHCHNYRRPQPFQDQTVAVVGAGPSGTDIAVQISKHAKKVSRLGGVVVLFEHSDYLAHIDDIKVNLFVTKNTL